MQMTNETAQEEKARRVWRLNQREGVPVLEALETVGISKDVYYRVKREKEEEWEETILSVEQIQNRLSEADELIEKREKQIETMRERLDDARSKLADIDDVSELEQDVRGNGSQIFQLEGKVEELERKVDSALREADLEKPMRTNDELRESVEETEERMREHVGEVQSTVEELAEVVNSHTERIEKLEEQKEESDGSGGLLGG